MNERPERNPRAFQEVMDKFIEEKPMPERMKESGEGGGPSLDILILEKPPEQPN
jgi:hypothetical protein